MMAETGAVVIMAAVMAQNLGAVRAGFDPRHQVIVVNAKLSSKERWSAVHQVIGEILEAPRRPCTRPARQRPGG